MPRMADTLRIHLGRATLDVEAETGERGISIAKVTSTLSFAETLKEVLASTDLSSVKNVQITARWLDWIAQRRLGSPVALIMTSGSESLLEFVGAPKRGWTLHPRRLRLPVERHLVFGINERTSAAGKTLTPVSEEDLLFIVEKLKMHNVTKVAVAFMHALKNSTNENFAVEVLKKNGLEVFQIHPKDRGLPALGFWGQLLVNSYSDSFYREEFAQIMNVLESFGLTADKVSIPGYHPDFPTNAPMSWSKFHETSAKILTCQEAGAQIASLYCGLEEFIFIPPSGEIRNLSPHPLHKLRFDAWKAPLVKDQDQVDWEPGPMLLGRSVEPTYMDMIGAAGLTTPFEKLGMSVTPAAKTKTLQAVDMMARSQHGTSVENFAHRITCFMAQSWAEQLLLSGEDRKIVLCGPLAETVSDVLNELQFPFDFSIAGESK